MGSRASGAQALRPSPRRGVHPLLWARRPLPVLRWFLLITCLKLGTTMPFLHTRISCMAGRGVTCPGFGEGNAHGSEGQLPCPAGPLLSKGSGPRSGESRQKTRSTGPLAAPAAWPQRSASRVHVWTRDHLNKLGIARLKCQCRF